MTNNNQKTTWRADPGKTFIAGICLGLVPLAVVMVALLLFLFPVMKAGC